MVADRAKKGKSALQLICPDGRHLSFAFPRGGPRISVSHVKAVYILYLEQRFLSIPKLKNSKHWQYNQLLSFIESFCRQFTVSLEGDLPKCAT